MDAFHSLQFESLKVLLKSCKLVTDVMEDIVVIICTYYADIVPLDDIFDLNCRDIKIKIDTETQTISNTQNGFAICCGSKVVRNGMAGHWEFVVKRLSDLDGNTEGDNLGIGLIHKGFTTLNEGMKLCDRDRILYWWSMDNAKVSEFAQKQSDERPYFELNDHLHIYVNLLPNNQGNRVVFTKNDRIVHQSRGCAAWPKEPELRMFVCLDRHPQVMQLVQAELVQ